MPDTEPEITVLIAVFNGERYLREALDSVLQQTMPRFELLVVDDNSDDSTAAILAECAQQDSRIRVLRNDTNLGPYPSANRGLGEALGKLIARVDADDNCAPDRLERQLSFMTDQPECLLVGGGYRSIDGAGQQRFLRHNPMGFDCCAFVSRLRMPMVHPSFCFRKTLPDGTPVRYDENHPIAGDFGLTAELARHGKIASLDAILVDYRMHDANISSTKLDRQQHFAHLIANNAIEEHYPTDIATNLSALLDVHYRRLEPSAALLKKAIAGLNAALEHDFPQGIPQDVRERAAGILGESFLGGGGLGAAGAFLANAPGYALPILKRYARLKNALPQLPLNLG